MLPFCFCHQTSQFIAITFSYYFIQHYRKIRKKKKRVLLPPTRSPTATKSGLSAYLLHCLSSSFYVPVVVSYSSPVTFAACSASWSIIWLRTLPPPPVITPCCSAAWLTIWLICVGLVAFALTICVAAWPNTWFTVLLLPVILAICTA